MLFDASHSLGIALCAHSVASKQNIYEGHLSHSGKMFHLHSVPRDGGKPFPTTAFPAAMERLSLTTWVLRKLILVVMMISLQRVCRCQMVFRVNLYPARNDGAWKRFCNADRGTSSFKLDAPINILLRFRDSGNQSLE